MRLRVVCGLSVTIATFCPTTRFRNVDFPAFGRPTIATNPARKLGFLLNVLLNIFLSGLKLAAREPESRACAREAEAPCADSLRAPRSDDLRDRSRHLVQELCPARDSANPQSLLRLHRTFRRIERRAILL